MLSIIRKVGRPAARHWPFPVRVTTRTGASMYVDLRFNVGQSIFARGEFDPPVLKVITEALKPDSVFLDIGANIGFYSVEAARVATRGSVHAFEMDRRSTRCLEKSARTFGLSQIKVHNTAVSNRTGETFFRVDKEEAGHSYLDPAAASGRAVPTVSIDHWVESNNISRIDVMKIDVEGAEMMVLEGARATLERFKPTLIIEADFPSYARFGREPQDAVTFVEGLGYSTQWLAGAWTQTLVAR